MENFAFENVEFETLSETELNEVNAGNGAKDFGWLVGAGFYTFCYGESGIYGTIETLWNIYNN